MNTKLQCYSRCGMAVIRTVPRIILLLMWYFHYFCDGCLVFSMCWHNFGFGFIFVIQKADLQRDVTDVTYAVTLNFMFLIFMESWGEFLFELWNLPIESRFVFNSVICISHLFLDYFTSWRSSISTIQFL